MKAASQIIGPDIEILPKLIIEGVWDKAGTLFCLMGKITLMVF